MLVDKPMACKVGLDDPSIVHPKGVYHNIPRQWTGAKGQALRSQSIVSLGELQHMPAIIALLKRAIEYHPEDLRYFRREGTRGLRQIAAIIGL
jgi:hypothetical protein